MGEAPQPTIPKLNTQVAIKGCVETGEAGRSQRADADGAARRRRIASSCSTPTFVVGHDVGRVRLRGSRREEFIEGDTLAHWLLPPSAARGPTSSRSSPTPGRFSGGLSRRKDLSQRLQPGERHDRRRREGPRHGLRTQSAPYAQTRPRAARQ